MNDVSLWPSATKVLKVSIWLSVSISIQQSLPASSQLPGPQQSFSLDTQWAGWIEMQTLGRESDMVSLGELHTSKSVKVCLIICHLLLTLLQWNPSITDTINWEPTFCPV